MRRLSLDDASLIRAMDLIRPIRPNEIDVAEAILTALHSNDIGQLVLLLEMCPTALVDLGEHFAGQVIRKIRWHRQRLASDAMAAALAGGEFVGPFALAAIHSAQYGEQPGSVE